MEWKNKAIDFLIQNGPVYLWAGLKALAFLLAGLFAGRWVSLRTVKFLTTRGFEPPVRMLASRLALLLCLTLGAFLALDNLNVKITPLIAGLGVLGVGLGLATQGVLSNVVAGLTIIFSKPFRVGEYVDVIGQAGLVDRIELMTTTLAHGDRSRVIIPNRKIVGEVVHNYGTIRQLDLKVGVSCDSNFAEVAATIREVLKNNPRVMKELAPGVGIAGLDDSCITMFVKPWTSVDDFGLAGTEIYEALLDKFRERKITIPVRKREIHILNGNGEKVSV